MNRALEAIRDRRNRFIAYAITAAILAILCLVPRPYEARAKILPQDSSSIGLGSMLGGGQAQGLVSLLGGARQPTDLYLAIARSDEVTNKVIDRLKLVGPDGYASKRAARVALERRVQINSLLGGVIEIEARTHDPDRAEALTQAYLQAITQRLKQFSLDRVERKRKVVLERFREATDRVSIAEAALTAFRRQNRLAEPEVQLGAELSLRAGLQAQLQAKLVELQTLREFQGAENPQLRAVESEIASLRSQISRSTSPSGDVAGPNVAGLTEVSGRYLDLFRDYRFAQALYQVYASSSEEVAVESLASESASDAQIIEAPRLDSDRKFNVPALAALILVVLIMVFVEYYAPATGIRVPIVHAPEPAA